MNAELLRRACELADLTLEWDVDDGAPVVSKNASESEFASGWDPCMAYVADRLANMLFPADPKHWTEYELTLCLAGATAEQRIRAALEVLGDD